MGTFVLRDRHRAIITKIPKIWYNALQIFLYSTRTCRAKHAAMCRTFLFVLWMKTLD